MSTDKFGDAVINPMEGRLKLKTEKFNADQHDPTGLPVATNENSSTMLNRKHGRIVKRPSVMKHMGRLEIRTVQAEGGVLWKPFYFSLEETKLLYFAHETSSKEEGHMMLNTGALLSDDRRRLFEITGRVSKNAISSPWILRANTQRKYAEWKRKLGDHVELVKAENRKRGKSLGKYRDKRCKCKPPGFRVCVIFLVLAFLAAGVSLWITATSGEWIEPKQWSVRGLITLVFAGTSGSTGLLILFGLRKSYLRRKSLDRQGRRKKSRDPRGCTRVHARARAHTFSLVFFFFN
jgi:hypothetical protein